MEKVIHIAGQYLATASISFLEPKDDDSHTNLGWINDALHTHALSKANDILTLDYRSFSLIWTNDSGFREELPLDQKTHRTIIEWIASTSIKAGIHKSYAYNLHYELPYEAITDDFQFIKPSDFDIEQLIKNRQLAQTALENALKIFSPEAPIRIWPHHFDTGSFFMTSDDLGIGLGMAIPDTMINDFYLYVSGYNGHESIVLSPNTSIDLGTYYSEGWKGIALAVSGITIEDATSFYKEAIQHYLDH